MDAFIYDHVRSPRGKGKRDGALHEVTAVELARQVLVALRDRSTLDTRLIEDVVLGCVMPVGEQGADIARIAALMAGYDESVPGVQINRFCSSGLEAVNMAAAKVMAGQALAAIGGGVESMSRVPMGSDGGAWAVDPAVAFPSYFVPQGISADLVATLHGHGAISTRMRSPASSAPQPPGPRGASPARSCRSTTCSASNSWRRTRRSAGR
jgi:acetyl-CoA C-acetyltransferase